MNIPQLDGLRFETAEGVWRLAYIGEPREPIDQDRIVYELRCKWIDPKNEDNKATPERRLRLSLYPSDIVAHGDFEQRLHAALRQWLEYIPDEDSTFECEEGHLKSRTT